jgi:predicted DNA-binding transcriptional regulator AlpA
MTEVIYDELLTGPEVAQILKISINTVNWWRCNGKGPRYIKLGTSLRCPVRYRHSDLQAYIASVTGGGHDGAE